MIRADIRERAGAFRAKDLRGMSLVAGDKRKVLEGDTFNFKKTKDGKVLLYHNGRQKKVLTGSEAEKFVKRMASVDHPGAQLLMAKATKNFKRGNEKMGKG